MDPDRILREAIYDAMVDDTAFAALAGHLTRHLGAASGWAKDWQGSGSMGTVSQEGLDPSAGPEYDAYWHAYDPWLAVSAKASPLVARSLEPYVPQSVLERSEFYNDFAARHGDVLHCLAMHSPIADGRLIVGFQRTRRQGPFDEAAERSLQALASDLRRLGEARRRLRLAVARADLIERAMDTDYDAVLVVGRGGHVHWMNAAARALLARGRPLVLASGGVIGIGAPEAAAWRRALTAALDDTRPLGGVLALAGPPVYSISLDPLPAAGSRHALVRVRDTDAHLRRKVDAMARRFGFTPSEAALAGSLARGLTVERHAALRDIKISTVRTQAHALLTKSGCTRQSELVARLLQTP